MNDEPWRWVLGIGILLVGAIANVCMLIHLWKTLTRKQKKKWEEKAQDNIVRKNIKSDSSYRPFCGNTIYHWNSTPRTEKKGNQFRCPSCGWVSTYEKEFADKYIKDYFLKEKEDE